MATPKKYVRVGATLAALLLVVAIGLLLTGNLPIRQYSDGRASVGVYFNPAVFRNPHCSYPHYIRVAGTTYSGHDGSKPGYFIVPELGTMIFVTGNVLSPPRTIHLFDQRTGSVVDVSEAGLSSWFDGASEASLGYRSWVHARSSSGFTLAMYASFADFSHIAFTSIDLDQRTVVEVNDFWFDKKGGLNEGNSKHPSMPAATLDELIGDHREQAGLLPVPVKPGG